MIDKYIEMHKDENLYAGSALRMHAQSIKSLIQLSESKTLLDYGCGKGIQYSKEKVHEEYFFDIMPSLYDPAVSTHDVLPKGKFDGVICTDVLEHIPEKELEKTFKQIFSKADKFVYLGICNIPADSFLPDGSNAHVTLESFDWWVDKILPHAKVKTQVFCYGLTKGNAVIENNKILLKKER